MVVFPVENWPASATTGFDRKYASEYLPVQPRHVMISYVTLRRHCSPNVRVDAPELVEFERLGYARH